MNLKQKFVNWLIEDKTPPVEAPKIELPRASVSFTIEEDGLINIEAFWDGDNKTAQMLGELLFKINAGMLAENINELLVEQGTEEDELEFVKIVGQTWNNLAQQKLLNSDFPMVHPIKTFGVSRVQ